MFGIKSGSARRIIPFIVVGLLWFFLGGRVNPLFIPSIGSVLESFQSMLRSGLLQASLQMSFMRITTATAISIAISIPLALLVITSKWAEDIITPITAFMRYIPVTAFYPLFILWVGIDEKMKIWFIFVATFLYFFPTVVLQFKSTDKDIIEAALTSGVSRLKLTYKVYLPMNIPGICQSFLMMYGIGWTYIVVAESINTTKGLGYLIKIGSDRANTAMVFAAILTIVIFAVFMDVLGNWIIRKAFKWYFTVGE